MKKHFVAPGLITALLVLSPSAAFSLGGGTDSSSNTNTTPACKTGFVFSKARKKCVRSAAQRSKKCKKNYIYSRSKKRCIRKWSQIIPDVELKEQGWALAYAGEFKSAIDVFSHIAAKNDPEALNGLGYSHRKLGMVRRGIGFYQKALKINPDYILAREYLGEGYVAAGRINLAKRQLSEIKKRCGTTCREYTILASVIKSESTRRW
jgi:tetratricopeptide (TPR) repeat protein